MKTLARSFVVITTLVAMQAQAQTDTAPPNDALPTALRANASLQWVATHYARGSQIYRCEAGATSQHRWVFQAPEADLFSDAAMTQLVGRHYDGPTWESLDGSRVAGKVRANAPAPDSSAIPWLLLDGGWGTVRDSIEDRQAIALLGAVLHHSLLYLDYGSFIRQHHGIGNCQQIQIVQGS